MGSKHQPAPPPAPDPNQIINAESQANRVNQITPYGSLTYSGPNNNTATLELSPQLQQLFGSQMGISQGLLDRAQGNLGNLPLGNPYSGFGVGSIVPGLQTVSQGMVPNAPTLGNVGVTPQSVPGLQTSIGGLDLTKALQLPPNYSAFNQDAANAFFNNSSGLLNQQFTRDENALRQRLANQGLQAGSAAFGDEFNQFNTNKNQQFGQLANQAVLYGGQDASRQLSDILNLHGAGANDALSAFNAGATQAGFGNQALQSQFGLNTAARDQALQNQLFGNDVIQQQYGLQNQQFNNLMNAANQNNAVRGQGFNEAGVQNQTQFNNLASLLGLQQVQTPQLNNFYAPGQVNAGDAFGLQQQGLQNTYNQQSQNAASKKGSSANLAGTLGSAALMAGMFMSDRRLKKAIQKIGKYGPYNVYVWTWNKIAESMGLRGHGLGVMADEVPLPFVALRGEYLAVDYGALR